MSRLRFLERHRRFDEAVVQWQNVREVRSHIRLLVCSNLHTPSTQYYTHALHAIDVNWS